jgi:hypothetical protein
MMASLPTPVNIVIRPLILIVGHGYKQIVEYNYNLGGNLGNMCCYAYSVMVGGAWPVGMW